MYPSTMNVHRASCQCGRTWPGSSEAEASLCLECQFHGLSQGQNVSGPDSRQIRMTGWRDACVSEGQRGRMAAYCSVSCGEYCFDGLSVNGNVSEACSWGELATLTSIPWDPGHVTPGGEGLVCS